MKNKIIAALCFLAAMALLPAAVVGFQDKNVKSASTADSAVKTENADDSEKICRYAAQLCQKDFCDEAIHAAIILANTDYYINPKNAEFDDYHSDSELYNKITRYYPSDKEFYVTYKNEICYVPYADRSNGCTVNSEQYEYITAAASPWDAFNEGFEEDKDCEGVSLSGLNYLCENGMSAQEALKWYLPRLEVEKL